jgi:hypothetical protein
MGYGTLELKRINQHLKTLNPSLEKVEALCGK